MWSCGHAPGVADDAYIMWAGTYTVTLDTDATAISLTLGGTGGTQTLAASSRTLTMSGASSVGTHGVMNLAGSTISGTGTLTNRGTMSLAGSTINTALDNFGTMSVTGGVSVSSAPSFTNNSSGIIQGVGTFDLGGAAFANNGTMNPGTPGTAGTLSLTGADPMSSTSILNIDIGGLTVGTQYDQLAASGSAALSGTLNVNLISSYVPDVGDTFTLLTYASMTGTFDAVVLPPLSGEKSWNAPSYGTTSLTLGVGPTPCVSAPSGLVAWWKGEGDASDAVGANNGTLVNGATFATGKVGQAFSLDGVDDYIDVPPATSLNLDNALTIAAWADPADYSCSDARRIVTKLNSISAPSIGYNFDIVCTTGKLRIELFDQSSNENYLLSNTTIPNGIFTYIAATWDGTTLKLYIDGVPDSQTSTTIGHIGTNGNDLTIGRFSSTSLFKGLIDEVQIYSRALDAGEIAAIYNAGSNGVCGP